VQALQAKMFEAEEEQRERKNKVVTLVAQLDASQAKAAALALDLEVPHTICPQCSSVSTPPLQPLGMHACTHAPPCELPCASGSCLLALLLLLWRHKAWRQPGAPTNFEAISTSGSIAR